MRNLSLLFAVFFSFSFNVSGNSSLASTKSRKNLPTTPKYIIPEETAFELETPIPQEYEIVFSNVCSELQYSGLDSSIDKSIKSLRFIYFEGSGPQPNAETITRDMPSLMSVCNHQQGTDSNVQINHSNLRGIRHVFMTLCKEEGYSTSDCRHGWRVGKRYARMMIQQLEEVESYYSHPFGGLFE